MSDTKKETKPKRYVVGYRDGAVYYVRALTLASAVGAAQAAHQTKARQLSADEAIAALEAGHAFIDATAKAPDPAQQSLPIAESGTASVEPETPRVN